LHHLPEDNHKLFDILPELLDDDEVIQFMEQYNS
jgi:hypothetical protein